VIRLTPDDEKLVDRFVTSVRVAAAAPSAEPVATEPPAAAAQRAGAELLARWSEPHRRYHDRRHLAAVLDRLDELALPDDPGTAAAIRLAAFFHDAVYEPLADDNEERSAELAEHALGELGWPAERRGEVARLVRLTREHRASPDDLAGALLCDADLAVLAAEPVAYAAYAADVRAEYAMVPDDLFRTGRAAILEALLESPAIYTTSAARARWEERARRNVTAEVSLLRAGADPGATRPPGAG
jgi:predicted metal-dependent HD superfamily phosphohydrolase